MIQEMPRTQAWPGPATRSPCALVPVIYPLGRAGTLRCMELHVYSCIYYS